MFVSTTHAQSNVVEDFIVLFNGSKNQQILGTLIKSSMLMREIITNALNCLRNRVFENLH